MPLDTHLKQLIQTQGPLTIAQFMQEALGHPDFGYYQKHDPFGATGDFITAPEISQVFGELLGLWCAIAWEQMGKPHGVALVELGPGRGTLMRDLLRGTQHIAGFHAAIAGHLVETSPHLTMLQQQTLAHSGIHFHWHTDTSTLPPKPLLLIANELFDALPIHQYVKTAEGWKETGVGLDAATDTFHYVPMPLQGTPPLEGYPNAKEGDVVEICPAGRLLTNAIAHHIAQYGGAALFIDYGYEENHFKATLQAVKSHRYHPVLEDVGDADLTAHVDFAALMKEAAKQKVNVFGTVPQSWLLGALGIEMRTKMLLQHMPKEEWPLFLSGIERLIHPGHMGELFKAMAMTASGMPVPTGFEKELP